MPLDGDIKQYAETVSDPVANVLMEAAAIVRRGWCQGVQEVNGPVCAMRAIRIAAGFPIWDVVDGHEWLAFHVIAQTGAAQRLAAHLSVLADDIWMWNDAHGRTAEEVASAMEAAARAR